MINPVQVKPLEAVLDQSGEAKAQDRELRGLSPVSPGQQLRHSLVVWQQF